MQLSLTGSDAIGSDAQGSQHMSNGRPSFRGELVLEPLHEDTEGAYSPPPSPQIPPLARATAIAVPSSAFPARPGASPSCLSCAVVRIFLQ